MSTATATIRLARAADAPVLAALSRDTIEAGLPWRYREPEMLRFMRSPRYNVIVAESAEMIAGFAVMGYGEVDAYLALLAVDKAQRRRGNTRQLVACLLKTADIAGTESISVELREDNTIAHGLYGSLGFVATGL